MVFAKRHRRSTHRTSGRQRKAPQALGSRRFQTGERHGLLGIVPCTRTPVVETDRRSHKDGRVAASAADGLPCSSRLGTKKEIELERELTATSLFFGNRSPDRSIS